MVVVHWTENPKAMVRFHKAPPIYTEGYFNWIDFLTTNQVGNGSNPFPSTKN